MKVKATIGALLLGFLVGVSFVGLTAQAPQVPAAVAPPAVATFSENERLMVQLVQVSDQLAGCRQQLGTKGVADLGDSVRSRIEAQHPGYTVDWKTGALVPKAPVK